MKKVGITLLALVVASLSWMAFVREPLPPIPVVTAELSEEVKFNFTINSMDYTGLEFSLKDKVEGKGMFVQFKMANAWKTGRTGLVVNGIRDVSDFKNGMSRDKYLNDPKRKEKKEKDFSDFMVDSKGKSLSTYTFKQTLVEDNKGKKFMRMTYDGPAMEMIQTLEIARPITLPAHISRRFVDKGIIQFQPGTLALDSKTKGFYIPVTVR